MSNINKIAKHLKVGIKNIDFIEDVDKYILGVDLSKPDEVLIRTHDKKRHLKIKDGRFQIHGGEIENDPLYSLSNLLIEILGWDDINKPANRNDIISYAVPTPVQEAAEKSAPILTVKAPQGTPSPQSTAQAFSQSATTLQEELEKRAQIWRSRGFTGVAIHNESVWIPVKPDVILEDCGDRLNLHGKYDTDAIRMMVAHAKETWGNKCNVDGDKEFKTLVWRECLIQGVTLANFEPRTKVKRQIMADLQSKQAAYAQSHAAAPQPVTI